jgi:galactokinase
VPHSDVRVVRVPGRVNLIGEHIDYHNLPVLPIAIQRSIRVEFSARDDRRIHSASAGFEPREFEWTAQLEPSEAGDWANYVKAAAQAVGDRWGLGRGIDATVESDLPPAAGLSSSSALLTAFTLALLEANGIKATFEELMDVLPEAEYFVGTRGGGMDHAAVLASRAGHALRVGFAPLTAESVPIPEDWSFLIAHSLTSAEKSGGAREHYNSRRVAGTRALEHLGLNSYAEASVSQSTALVDDDERRAFHHVTSEAARVYAAVQAMREDDAATFGRLLNESHVSMRDDLRISCDALDELVQKAQDAGAVGARLTGAGFGGCAILFCLKPDRERLRDAIIERFYASRTAFDPHKHLIIAEPSAGALYA